jgi:hypothetical protein
MSTFSLVVRCALALVFAWSTFGKLRSRAAFEAFMAWLADMVPPGAGRRSAVIVVAGETTSAVLLAVPATARLGLAVAAALLASYAVSILLALRREAARPACHCFGASARPLGRRHLARSTGLAVAAGVAAAFGSPARLHPTALALALAGGVVAALLIVNLDDLVSLLPSRRRAVSMPTSP